MPARPAADLKPLTALRFVAALLVFCYHAPATQPLAAVYATGQAGVGFFFVLSGFILTFAYADSFTARAPGALRAFYVARFARIYPVYVAAMLAALVTLAALRRPHPSVSAIVAHLALVQSWIPVETIYLGVNAPAWSISVEAAFYALFPLLVRSLGRSFERSGAPSLYLAAAVAWCIQTAIVLVPHPVAVWTAYIFPPVRMLDFLTGMLCGLAFLRRARDVSPHRATWFEAAALAVLVAALAWSPHVPVALRYTLFLMPFWALLIAVFAGGGGAFSRVLAHPLAVRLGELSFAFYLLHISVLALVAGCATLPAPLAAAIAFGVTLTAAGVLHDRLERPLRDLLRSRLARPPRLDIAPERAYRA